MIISTHLPKTAGTSFGSTLKRTFGSGFLRDYLDYPINTPVYERNRVAMQNSLSNAEDGFEGVTCIHGHFLPLKYLLMSNRQDLTFITWLRDPVERAISHYHFWKRKYNPQTAPPLHRKMVEEKWSLERFCLGAEVRNIYSQFLYGFPLEYFSFIGITEFYDEDFAFFMENFMDSTFEPEKRNVRERSANGDKIDKSFREDIEKLHSKDMDLYRRALEMRLTRRENLA